jgi:hypothetical protein
MTQISDKKIIFSIINMDSYKELSKQYKNLGLTRTQKKKLGLKGRLNKEQLKQFLENYKPLRQADYLDLLNKAKELGYKFEKGKSKETLINWIKDRERKNKRNEKLRNKRKEKKIYDLIDKKQFQKVLDLIFIEKFTLDERQANTFWNAIINKRYVITITINNVIQHLPVNQTTAKFFFDLFTNGFIEPSTNETYGSDILELINPYDIEDIKISQMKEPKRLLKNKDGKFFPYINTTKLDLSKYQIYNQEQAYEIEKREHCLIQALILAGVRIEIINNIKLSYVCGVHIRKNDLPNIAEMCKRNINIFTMKGDRINTQKIKVNDSNDPDINIALFEEHYFILEDTDYTLFFIKNYSKLFEVENPYSINRIKNVNGKDYYYRTNETNKINSLIVVYNLFKQDYFKKLDLIRFEECSSSVKTRDNIYLDNIENEQRLYYEDYAGVFDNREYHYDKEKRKYVSDNPERYAKAKSIVEAMKKQENKVKKIFYADCESFVYSQPHRLYLLGVVSNSNDIVNIFNTCESSPEQVVYNFLNIVSNFSEQDAIVYFHNLKYDYHLLESYLNIKEKVVKDNQIYSIKVYFNNCTIELRDSYKLIPIKLASFQENFNLPKEYHKKEAIAYSYYTEHNNNNTTNIDEYIHLLKENEKSIFLANMKTEPSFNKKDNTFNPLSYYKEYLRLDCLCLKKGLIEFNELIKEATDGMSIYNSLTISSLTDKYMKENGAYNDVYEVCGNLREYISRAVYGGRVCVNEKYKKKVIEGKISDYDGVSLYPSSINRLCREIGLPTGEAKRLKDQDWKNFKYSILTIQVLRVNKIQKMPFIAYKKDGVISYTNEPPKEPIIIDSITLEDYIKFHKIDYEVLDGVYWEGDFNDKMGELIDNLFQTRMMYKKDKPALANTIKLMLNSSYGKTIMKKSNTQIQIVYNSDDGSTFDSYVYNNFNTIKSYRQLNKYNFEIEKIRFDNSYNRGHIGCAILSMSKRIMNEVFDIANDIDCPIYYTDTDSLHCNFDDVSKIEAKYKEVYNKELNGKNLEQFHTDFNLKGACSEIYATKSIFLGKKSYMDYLESEDKNGNKINGFHIRLKGITEEGLHHTAENYKDSYIGLYTELAEGKSIKFLLNPKDKVLFEYKAGQVSTKQDFYRQVKF